MNEQLTPEAYNQRMAQLDLQTASQVYDIQSRLARFIQKYPQRENRNIMTEGAYGNYLYQVKEVYHSYDCSDAEECRYCTQLQLGSKFCYDMYQFGVNIDHCYECTQTGLNISNCAFCYSMVENCFDMLYCLNCFSSKNCFACYGLKKHQYCILNKQYTKEEYFNLLEKCIQKMQEDGEWGEFHPASKSHIPYNDSMAQIWFPITQKKAEERGLTWKDESQRNKELEGEHHIPLPISQYDESIVGYETANTNITACISGMIKCQKTGRAFTIIKQELLFYLQNKIPLPTHHPDERRQRRKALRDSRYMYNRTCAQCGCDIATPYSPERPEKVVCEECYRKLVY